MTSAVASQPAAATTAARAVGVTKIYGRARPRCARSTASPSSSRRSVHRDHGSVGLGQVDAAALPRRARPLTAGQVCIGDIDIAPQREAAHVVRRDKIGFIFQAFNLIPTLTAMENITLPMALAGRKPDQGGSTRSSTRSGSRDRLHPPAVGALGRPAAARRRCARAREPARDHLRRRAHREPRLAGGRGDPGVHAPGGRRVRPDDRDGHARPDRRRRTPTASCSSPTARSSTSSRPDRRRDPRQDAQEARGVDHVLRVTLKGLFAHKLRFALTALAVMFGVAFLSGTMVFTDTIKKTFDELFADINQGTDAYVRARRRVEPASGRARRSANAFPRRSSTRSRRSRGREASGGERPVLRAARRQQGRHHRTAARTTDVRVQLERRQGAEPVPAREGGQRRRPTTRS